MLLLLIPFIALLWVPFYNRIEPTFFDIPFFYWYQFLWVILTSLVILVVDICTRAGNAARADQRTGRSEEP
jgi:Protein of unknown function (DUF3311)